jgi:hypothetical protein
MQQFGKSERNTESDRATLSKEDSANVLPMTGRKRWSAH